MYIFKFQYVIRFISFTSGGNVNCYHILQTVIDNQLQYHAKSQDIQLYTKYQLLKQQEIKNFQEGSMSKYKQ